MRYFNNAVTAYLLSHKSNLIDSAYLLMGAVSFNIYKSIVKEKGDLFYLLKSTVSFFANNSLINTIEIPDEIDNDDVKVLSNTSSYLNHILYEEELSLADVKGYSLSIVNNILGLLEKKSLLSDLLKQVMSYFVADAVFDRLSLKRNDLPTDNMSPFIAEHFNRRHISVHELSEFIANEKNITETMELFKEVEHEARKAIS